MSDEREQVARCPECGQEMTYEPPHKAERDTGTAEFRGGLCCPCGYADERPEPEEPELFDEMTGPCDESRKALGHARRVRDFGGAA